ncbi:Gpr1 family protein [Mycena metata]|uniref:Gpr1 family protein n=1 Tax=Mycena metata TaxID=1033252 RepID=A0AAD7MKP4_9AGAR|nr:Gpr1 family protein [Mycena metata]
MGSSSPEKGHASRHEIYREQREMDTNEGPAHPSGISNPAPLGLISFASTTFIVSMYNVNVRGITTTNVVVGMGIFTGGFTQFIAGMWEFPRGNVFGATAFSTYGAFWMAYATIFIPGSGILAAYDDPNELASALGIFLIAWFLVTLFFLNISFVLLLSSASVVFACLAAAEFSQNPRVTKAGGIFGIITAFLAYYIALSEMMAAERRRLLKLPTGNL